MNISDQDIVFALIDQVTRAARGRPEYEVVTVISRPMWNAFCRWTGIPENSEPSDWKGAEETIRVYGSETYIVERPDYWSASSLNFVKNASPEET